MISSGPAGCNDSASRRTPSRMPREASSGVEKTLRILTSPRSRTTQSVNVPPVSTPKRIVVQDSGVRIQGSEVKGQRVTLGTNAVILSLLAVILSAAKDLRFL